MIYFEAGVVYFFLDLMFYLLFCYLGRGFCSTFDWLESIWVGLHNMYGLMRQTGYHAIRK